MEKAEITGISRFGRLRKKSSKLIDLIDLQNHRRRHHDEDHTLNISNEKNFLLKKRTSDKILEPPNPEMIAGDKKRLENADSENSSDSLLKPLSAKSTKRFKKRKVVNSKPCRRDKGISRISSYMLWAKDVRLKLLTNQPNLDFASVSRKLGQMWANVPLNEKNNFKRKAKRLSNVKYRDKNHSETKSQPEIETIWLS